ncbi:MAG: hypothetical protein PUC61_09240 [Bacteroidales bacterium]|nr:hypothetical protein [Bacteroidales bacterium]
MEQEYALGAGCRYLLANAEVLKIDTARKTSRFQERNGRKLSTIGI